MDQNQNQATDHKSGLMLIDKPAGITSFDVIRILRKKLGVKKMGHAGTLDPRATGLLIVAYGQNTKQLKDFLGLPKTYVAEIKLGIKTTTGDLDGAIIEKKSVPQLSEKNIEDVVKTLIGKHELQVPIFSAIKKNGKPLYVYARAGKEKEIEIPVKPMRIYEARLEKIEGEILTVYFNVASGTYIRSLAEELGRKLGTVATLQALRRTSIGNYKIEDAVHLE